MSLASFPAVNLMALDKRKMTIGIIALIGVWLPYSSASADRDDDLRTRFDTHSPRQVPILNTTAVHFDTLRGKVIGWSTDGFVLEVNDKINRDVEWSELAADECFRLQGRLIEQERDGRADHLLQLGIGLLQRDREPGARALAEQALAKAVELDPRLTNQAREAFTAAPTPRSVDDFAAPSPPAAPAASTVPDADLPGNFDGTWSPDLDPSDVAGSLRSTFGFTGYRTDGSDPFHDPYMTARRAPVEPINDPSRGFPHKVYPDWWNVKSTTGDILWALGDFPPDRLFTKNVDSLKVWTQYLVQGDPDISCHVAEMYVRACRDEDLPVALELLAVAYQRAGEAATVSRLLREGVNYKPAAYHPPSAFDDIETLQTEKVPTDDAAGLIRNAAAAILRADARTADRALRLLEPLRLSLNQQRETNRLHARLARLTRGLAYSLQNHPPTLAAVEAALARITVRRAVHEASVPLATRLDPLPLPEVLAEFQHELDVFGPHASTTADLLLYLIEERGWSGLEIDAKSLYHTAFHINKFYSPARAIAPYVLVQKVGRLRPPGPTREDFRQDYFAAAECGIYLQRCFEDNERLLAHPDAWATLRPVIALAAEMCNDPSGATGLHEFAWRHRILSIDALVDFDALYNHSEASIELVEKQLKTMPGGFGRHFMRQKYIAFLHDVLGNLEGAVQQAKLMAEGVDAVGARHTGIRLLQEWATEHDREDLYELSLTLVRRAQADVKAQVVDDKYRDHLMSELQNLSTEITRQPRFEGDTLQ